MNIKNLNIDCDDNNLLVTPLNAVGQTLNLTRGNTYVLQANCYSNSYTNTFSSFSASDSWIMYIGDQYESNAAPVVIVSNAASWNQVADWSDANVANGMICVKANVDGTALDVDLANASSKNYTVEIVLTNNVGGKVTVLDNKCTISNAVQK